MSNIRTDITPKKYNPILLSVRHATVQFYLIKATETGDYFYADIKATSEEHDYIASLSGQKEFVLNGISDKPTIIFLGTITTVRKISISGERAYLRLTICKSRILT